MPSLEREIQQARPFASQCQEASLSLLRTADAMRRLYTVVMAPFGVTFQQYNVLRILRGAGDAGLAANEIAGRMIEQSPGLTRLLDRLEERGWAQRTRSRSDRRQVICRITPEGLALVDGMAAAVREAEERAMRAFDDGAIAAFIATLGGLREQLGEAIDDA
jgi:MarR family transcriptional regulator, organic hydroperoxide resistance regulator